MADDSTWTIKRILDWTKDYLEKKGDEHSRLSAEWLLSAATGLSRIEIYMYFDRPLDPEELTLMREGVRRRAAGEPLQYVTGEMPFRHIIVKCAPEVLIPRPETEILVDEALAAVDAARAAHKDPVHVVEVGCGTGCISCSIAQERPFTRVNATDISPFAAALATQNVERLGLSGRVSITEADLYSGIPHELKGHVDVIVSNPPYIPTDVMETLPYEVAGFEPHLALDGGADGLDIFRRLLSEAPEWLCAGGVLAVELFEESLDDAQRLVLSDNRWQEAHIVQDLTQRPRIIVARLR